MLKDRITGTLNKTSVKDVSVLIVEDDPRFQKMLKDMLHIFGFINIKVANNGDEAIKIFNSKNFDLIFSDWQMEGMDGIELLNNVRKNLEYPTNQIPLIFITGKAEEADVQFARDSGVTEFLVKPFTVNQIREKIISVFDNPRKFILCESYNGPCRRRKNLPPPNNIERRAVV